jgi:hypothetical protein
MIISIKNRQGLQAAFNYKTSGAHTGPAESG